jgi:hypothetical protein
MEWIENHTKLIKPKGGNTKKHFVSSKQEEIEKSKRINKLRRRADNGGRGTGVLFS